MSRRTLRKVSDQTKHRDTTFTPSSLNEEQRTIEVIAATETPVARWYGSEILQCTRQAIDATRLKGLPVIDSHDRSSVLSVLGQVTAFRIENRQLVATIKFADSERGRQAFDLVKSGMLNKVSVGYTVQKYEEADVRGGTSSQTVTAWTPFELSLVSVPADHNATIRGVSDMDPEDDLLENDSQQQNDNQRTNQRPARSKKLTRELAELRETAVRSGLSGQDVDDEFEDIRSISGARERIFEMLADRVESHRTSPSRTREDDRGGDLQNQIADAIASRLGASIDGNGNPYIGRSIIEIGRSFYEASGVSLRGMSDIRIAEVMMGETRAFGGGAHTTSDFSFLMDMGANRALLDRYNSIPTPIKTLATKRSVRDFRKQTFIRPGEAPRLLEIQEDGELKYGTFGEGNAELQIKSYGRVFALTRQAMINDDLGVFADFIQHFASSTIDTEGDLLFALLSANGFGGVKLTDGKNLFHADHENLASAGTVIDIASVTAGRKAMRLQKNINGAGTAGVVPAVLLVGPAQETAAEKFVTEINATTTSDTNPFSGKLRVLVENRYTGNGWWLFGDPATRPALVWGYLEGYEEPRVRSESPFGRQATLFAVEHDFGCNALDYRAAYFNPGA
ncbi:prohead protease/major capsid protein fusion protein [Rhizobium leguminosarum]|uniref:prohead protease/major capsid protein fusion protein n=1 Tax=Rhizobium leguminosarum TaxID=384 RepID=UPI003F973E34